MGDSCDDQALTHTWKQLQEEHRMQMQVLGCAEAKVKDLVAKRLRHNSTAARIVTDMQPLLVTMMSTQQMPGVGQVAVALAGLFVVIAVILAFLVYRWDWQAAPEVELADTVADRS